MTTYEMVRTKAEAAHRAAGGTGSNFYRDQK